LEQQIENNNKSSEMKQSFDENEFDAEPDEQLPHKNHVVDQLKYEEISEPNSTTNCEQQSDDWETYSSTIEPIYPNYSNGTLLHSTSVTGIINPFAIFVPNSSEYRNPTEHSIISNLSDYYSIETNFDNSPQQLSEINNYRKEEIPTSASRPFTLSGFLQNTYQNTSIPPSIISNSFLMEDNFLDFFASDGASTIKLD